MSKVEVTPCVMKRVNALIANTATKFTEDDRVWLEDLEDAQLEAMFPIETAQPKEASITPEMAVNALKSGLKEKDDFINLMPSGMQEQMRSALVLHEQRKATLVQSIITNTGEGVWTKEELEVMKFDQLEKLAKTAGFKETSQENYVGMGAGTGTKFSANENDDVPIMAPMGVNFEQK